MTPAARVPKEPEKRCEGRAGAKDRSRQEGGVLDGPHTRHECVAGGIGGLVAHAGEALEHVVLRDRSRGGLGDDAQRAANSFKTDSKARSKRPRLGAKALFIPAFQR